jgi:23S rRNA (cytidine1920-2'-O)/16S rRNA (cytidine1409-2'-O)-methyltransferase
MNHALRFQEKETAAKMLKKRLDLLLSDRGMVQSRQKAQSLIMAGKVFVNGNRADKPGMLTPDQAEIVIKGVDHPYVSRGGVKLKAAMDRFQIDVTGFCCMDVGASTGGFTDCLIQHGAARVYAVDVGYGQLAWKLRNDSRVIVIEKTNIRHMLREKIPESMDLITVDVSFISLKIVLPTVLMFLKKNGSIVALIKPQFEVGKGLVGKGGVVRDPFLHNHLLKELTSFLEGIDLTSRSIIPSPISGPKGNLEFLIHIVPAEHEEYRT